MRGCKSYDNNEIVALHWNMFQIKKRNYEKFINHNKPLFFLTLPKEIWFKQHRSDQSTLITPKEEEVITTAILVLNWTLLCLFSSCQRDVPGISVESARIRRGICRSKRRSLPGDVQVVSHVADTAQHARVSTPGDAHTRPHSWASPQPFNKSL